MKLVFMLAPFLVVGPLQTLTSLYLLWPSLGYSCLGAALAICTLTPIQIFLNSLYRDLRRKIAAHADDRVCKVNEIIMALKLIKLYGWEQSLRRVLLEVRKRETDLIGRESTIKGISGAFICISPKLVLFVTIITHCLVQGHSLDSQTLFVSMALLNNLHLTMSLINPRAVALVMELWVSCLRIQEFLLQPEISTDTLGASLTPLPLGVGESEKPTARVEFSDVSATWPESTQRTFEGITFKCQAPQLVVLCGQIASGKSSIILTVIDELLPESGHARVNGSYSYSSQRAWTFEGSVRENIIFGREFEATRYEQVIEACALKSDFEMLAGGDLTYIQENTLSGGQKARVNLARCLYGECDIYLLDDPLSALDSRVARHIFEEAIKRFLKGKLVIMSTHQVDLIKQSDKLLLVDQGKQLAFCSFDELCDKMRSDDEFKRSHSSGTLSWLESLVDGSQCATEAAGHGSASASDSTGAPGANCRSNPANYENTAIDVNGGQARGSVEVGKNKGEESYGGQMPANKTPDRSKYFEKNSALRGESAASGYIGIEPTATTKVDGANAASEAVHAPYGSLDSSTNGDETLIIATDQKQENSADSSASEAPLGSGTERTESQPKCGGHERSLGTGGTSSSGCREKAGSRPVNKVNLISDASQPTDYRPGLDQSRSESAYGCAKAPVREEARVDLGSQRQALRLDGRPASEDAVSERMASTRIWFQYYTQTSVLRFVLVVLTFVIAQALFSSVDIYLTVWSKLEQSRSLVSQITEANQREVDNFQHLVDVNYHVSGKNNGTGNHTIPYDQLSYLNELPLLAGYLPQASSVQEEQNESSTVASEAEQVTSSPLPPSQSLQWRALRDSNSFTDESLYGTSCNCSAHNSANISTDSLTFGELASSRPGAQSDPPSASATSMTSALHNASTTEHKSLVDENMLLQSEAGQNVAPVYRPLYLLVNCLDQSQHAVTYAVLVVLLFFFSLASICLFLGLLNNSTIDLYKRLIDSALFSKIVFFDQNPVGRFLNRATYDIGVMDTWLPFHALQAYQAILMTVAGLLVVASVDLILSVPSLVVLSLLLAFHFFHIVSTKEIKRLESISRSPIVSHISTSLEGVQTIRSNKAEERFAEVFRKHINFHTSIYLLYIGADRFLAVFLDSINCTYVAVITVWAILSGMNGASAGLAITTAMLLSGVTQHGIMKWTEAESSMTSVERVIEYCNLPQEDYGHGKQGKKPKRKLAHCNDISPPSKWPTMGRIEYKCVDLYYNKTGKPVLKNLSFTLEPGEKLAIVGRTGAGKSSIISTLFRLYDYDGQILIDGCDIKNINLIELRTSIGIIPQSPVLLSDSIRKNLDPTNAHDDFSMWDALDKAHLRSTISALPGKLDYIIGNGSGGFSSGQKQLFCLARVLLRKCKIIVMDEATANVDPATDAIIQATIRHEFKQSTVITIAHRLKTILDYDRIMVLDAGRIVDFDTPEQLAVKSNSYIGDQLRKHSQR